MSGQGVVDVWLGGWFFVWSEEVGRCPVREGQADSPEMATAAPCTHPTGMHTCLQMRRNYELRVHCALQGQTNQ